MDLDSELYPLQGQITEVKSSIWAGRRNFQYLLGSHLAIARSAKQNAQLRKNLSEPQRKGVPESKGES